MTKITELKHKINLTITSSETCETFVICLSLFLGFRTIQSSGIAQNISFDASYKQLDKRLNDCIACHEGASSIMFIRKQAANVTLQPTL